MWHKLVCERGRGGQSWMDEDLWLWPLVQGAVERNRGKQKELPKLWVIDFREMVATSQNIKMHGQLCCSSYVGSERYRKLKYTDNDSQCFSLGMETQQTIRQLLGTGHKKKSWCAIPLKHHYSNTFACSQWTCNCLFFLCSLLNLWNANNPQGQSSCFEKWHTSPCQDKVDHSPSTAGNSHQVARESRYTMTAEPIQRFQPPPSGCGSWDSHSRLKWMEQKPFLRPI